MKSLSLLIAMLLLHVAVVAQVGFRSVDELLAFAHRQSLMSKLVSKNNEVASKEILIRRAALYPQVNVFGIGEYYPVLATQVIPESIFGGQDGKFRTVQFGLPWNFSAGIELSVPVLNAERYAQLGKSRLELAEVEASGKTAMESLDIQLVHYYYQALLAKQLLRLNEENRHTADTLVALLRLRRNEGTANPADYNRALNLRLQVIAQDEQYRNSYSNSIAYLKRYLDISPNQELTISDSIEVRQIPSTIFDTININGRGAFVEAGARMAVAEQSLREIQNAALPRISLYSRYNYNWQMSDGWRGQPIHFDVNVIGMRMDMPIFNGFNLRSRKQKAELLIDAAALQREKAAGELLQQQQEWRNNFATAMQKLNILSERVQIATDNMRIGRLSVGEGVMEYEEFHNIFLEFNESRMDYLQNAVNAAVYAQFLKMFN